MSQEIACPIVNISFHDKVTRTTMAWTSQERCSKVYDAFFLRDLRSVVSQIDRQEPTSQAEDVVTEELTSDNMTQIRRILHKVSSPQCPL